MEQHLPGYKETFSKYPLWEVKETKHYKMFHLPNSEADKEMEWIAKRQEKSFGKIIRFLAMKPLKRKISYYFYPNRSLKKKLMGDDWYAQAIYKDFCVHLLYTKKIKPIGEHEDTHLLSLPWGLSTGLFQEGLAEYLAGRDWYGEDHDKSVRTGIKRKIYPPISWLMSHKNWMKASGRNTLFFYCLAGSFVRFLIRKFDKAKFKELYKKTSRKNTAAENTETFESVYKMSVSEVEKKWRRKVQKIL